MVYIIKYRFYWGLKYFKFLLFNKGAGIAKSVEWLSYGLDGTVFEPRQEFSLLQNVQTGCGAHPVSYSMDTWR